MYAYAQTNIQLFNQLRRYGYRHSELGSVCDAYALTMRLFTGCFRPSGKTFISHLVGTASILADLHASVPTVVAGLLHSAYSHGEFGTGARGISAAKRKQLRLAVGTQAEDIVARYTNFAWNQQAIAALHQTLPAAGSIDHEVLLIRLANELEDHLDLAGLYSGFSEGRREVIESYLYLCTDMAVKLGFPSLAAALSQAFEDTLTVELPQLLQQENENLSRAESVHLIGGKSSFLFPPATHGLRLSVRLARILKQRLIARTLPLLFLDESSPAEDPVDHTACKPLFPRTH
jgi:(p)ppGpp synthase/HD superfamily hydrolase